MIELVYMRPIRNSDPYIYRLITIRTDEARLWMVPSNSVRELIGGIIARYQEIFKVEIFAYCVLSNHYHLLVRALKGNIDEFESELEE
jgi:REP element-mobilizing transposase RayT